MTDKLYYESSHRKDFEAQVISCESEGEGYKVLQWFWNVSRMRKRKDAMR